MEKEEAIPTSPAVYPTPHTEQISVRYADVFTIIDDVNTLRKAGLGAMIILEQPSSAACVPNMQLCIATIFAIGILACLILCVAAFALLVSLMTLALQAIGELATQLLLVYQQGDSVVRLIMLCRHLLNPGALL